MCNKETMPKKIKKIKKNKINTLEPVTKESLRKKITDELALQGLSVADFSRRDDVVEKIGESKAKAIPNYLSSSGSFSYPVFSALLEILGLGELTRKVKVVKENHLYLK